MFCKEGNICEDLRLLPHLFNFLFFWSISRAAGRERGQLMEAATGTTRCCVTRIKLYIVRVSLGLAVGLWGLVCPSQEKMLHSKDRIMRVRCQFQKIRCTTRASGASYIQTYIQTMTCACEIGHNKCPVQQKSKSHKCKIFWHQTEVECLVRPVLPELLVVQPDTLTGTRSNDPSWAASYKYSTVPPLQVEQDPGDLNRASTIMLTIIWEGQRKKKNCVRMWEKELNTCTRKTPKKYIHVGTGKKQG